MWGNPSRARRITRGRVGLEIDQSYDALDRVTRVAYGDQTIGYTYDAGANGVGRLTGASDSSQALSWGYDSVGRVVSKTQTIGTVTRTVGYAYTNGQWTTLTTPSGQTVSYGYSAGRVTSVAVNGTTVLSGVLYEPFGPVRGWNWGNGTLAVRTYDQDGKITQWDSAGLRTYAYDDAFRITGITDATTSANSWTYGYDSLDRLSSGVSVGTTRGWSYDKNGNRLAETGTAPSTYAVSTTSNRVASVSGSLVRTLGYDAAGNVLTYSDLTHTYNNRGRLKSTKKGTGSLRSYVYNALGQRVKASGGTGVATLFAYDEAGHLLGEYNSTGGLIQETVWLGDIPVATLRPGTPIGIFYVHTDHLNTPRQVTRPSDNKKRWEWNPDPFGTTLANENPSGLGAFKYNLRFPGQLYEVHSGLHYNYFRDYDPLMGRYVESDPIGLFGGINTYAYAKLSPVQFMDPSGQNAAAALLGFGYACAVTGCAIDGIFRCHRAFPNHADPLSSDRAPYSKCTNAVLEACTMLNFAADPAGSTASEVGKQIGLRATR